jgi:hypothetical protein
MHSGCPFYGYRWPDRQPVLEHVGGNNCGLALDAAAPCLMESRGDAVAYDRCSKTLALRFQLDSVRRLIVFREGGQEVRLSDWYFRPAAREG